MEKAITILLEGNLYRSGFRFFILQKAVELGIKGYVKYENRKNIFVHVEGEISKIEEFAEWCSKGTLSCKVLKSKIEDTEHQNYSSFDIIKSN